MTTATEPSPVRPLPRELADGVFWIGECIQIPHEGGMLHGYHSSYLVTGSECSLLVEGGHPKDVPVLEGQLAGLLESGAPPLRYVFTTHSETPHSGGMGRLLDSYPEAVACGDMSDLHLAFPQYVDRLVQLDPGDSLDLGGVSFEVVPAVLRDYPYSRWGFDSARRVLFSGDGFAYSHYHQAGMCGRVAEEVPELEIPQMTKLFAELALYWTRFTELEPYIERLDQLLFEELEVSLVAPTHGLPITDPAATMPAVREGLRLGAAAVRES